MDGLGWTGRMRVTYRDHERWPEGLQLGIQLIIHQLCCSLQVLEGCMRENCTKIFVPKERRRTAIQVTFSRTAPVGFELGFDFISFGIICRWVRMGSKYERRMDEKSLQLWIATAWAPLAAARSNMRRFSCILTAVDVAKVWRSVEQRLDNDDWRCNRVVRCGREPMRRIYKM